MRTSASLLLLGLISTASVVSYDNFVSDSKTQVSTLSHRQLLATQPKEDTKPGNRGSGRRGQTSISISASEL